MPLNQDKVIAAVIHCTTHISELNPNPTANADLMVRIGDYMKMKKGAIRKTLRPSLKFWWAKNTDGFPERIQKGVKEKSTGSRSENCEKDAKKEGNDSGRRSSKDSQPDFDCESDTDIAGEDSIKLPGPSASSRRKFIFLSSIIKLNTADILIDNKVCPDRFHYILRKALPNESSIKCSIVFTGFRFSQVNEMVFSDYAFCKQPNCEKTFRFNGTVSKQSRYTIVKIFREKDVESSEHTLPIAYQLRGHERQDVKQELRYKLPSQVRRKALKEMDVKLAEEDNNYMMTRSQRVYEKARAEERGKNDLDSDDTIDIIKRMMGIERPEHPFILRFITPFTIYLGYEKQINFVKKCKGSILHLDATGQAIKKPYGRSKRVLVTSGIVNVNHKLVPALQMISNKNDAIATTEFLVFFRRFWEEHNISWPVFSTVVIDWAWAGGNALMVGWNDTTVIKYLTAAYNHLEHGADFDFIKVHFCISCIWFLDICTNMISQKSQLNTQ